jgi:hypothetical protein
MAALLIESIGPSRLSVYARYVPPAITRIRTHRKGFRRTGEGFVSTSTKDISIQTKHTCQNLIPAKSKEQAVEVPRNLGNSTNGSTLGFDIHSISCLLESYNKVLALALAKHRHLLLKALAVFLIDATNWCQVFLVAGLNTARLRPNETWQVGRTICL